ncbi:Outer membrane protein OmpA [Formivibrio citricus]|uniref:Outer membrane protein OmpA n=1 Tax=Formivibrio citricus TaxID=83765 RepID=A0A1I4YXR4_9NEIS|nr:OmpA family protein [Formivibrio citricus]SFN42792.1 Outer membrane protein OmpA [Formivibrio citricus]
MSPNMLIAAGIFCAASSISHSGIEVYVQGATATPAWKNSYGECWRTGTWTKEAATVEGCDGYVKPVPPAPAAEKPEPAPVVQPQPKSPPQPKVYTLKADVLFDFDRYVLKPGGKKALDELYRQAKAADPSNGFVSVTGHADRIGTEKYNLKLSKARARTVADYLMAKGKQEEKIKIMGMGETQPVTGHTCDKVHPFKKLVECLAPDRRVEIVIQGKK